MAEVTLFHNGKIYTCDSRCAHAEAMLVRGRRIVWVGDDSEMDEALACAVADEHVVKEDLGGRRVLPGFIDNHMHPVELAEYSRQISILPPHITNMEEMVEAIRCEWEALGGSKAATDGSVWIQGWGFDEGKLAEHRTPDRYDLDRGASDIPVSIVRACQHIRVLNSKALEICGIDASTPDPEGGQIDRDEKGEPTGILRENARLLAVPFIPEPDRNERADMITELGDFLASQGVVAIAELGSLKGNDDIELFRRAIDKGFRQDVAMYCMWEDCKNDPAFEITPEQMVEGQQLRICGLKILGDGTFSGHTAWMEEPYPGTEGQDDADRFGMSTCSDELLESAMAFCREHRCQLALHAMGRRTIRRFVDRLADEQPWTDSDPKSESYFPYVRLEHVTDPAPESIAKAASTGMAWSTQPIFLYSEIESYLVNLGEEWTKRCYPIKSIIDAGLPLSLSTDSPATAWATPSDPLVSIKAAVKRIAYDGTDCNAADGPDERIDIETAIQMYTSEAAKIMGVHDLGKIAPGFRASFVVLDKDILTEDDVHITATYINGERIL